MNTCIRSVTLLHATSIYHRPQIGTEVTITVLANMIAHFYYTADGVGLELTSSSSDVNDFLCANDVISYTCQGYRPSLITWIFNDKSPIHIFPNDPSQWYTSHEQDNYTLTVYLRRNTQRHLDGSDIDSTLLIRLPMTHGQPPLSCIKATCNISGTDYSLSRTIRRNIIGTYCILIGFTLHPMTEASYNDYLYYSDYGPNNQYANPFTFMESTMSCFIISMRTGSYLLAGTLQNLDSGLE